MHLKMFCVCELIKAIDSRGWNHSVVDFQNHFPNFIQFHITCLFMQSSRKNKYHTFESVRVESSRVDDFQNTITEEIHDFYFVSFFFLSFFITYFDWYLEFSLLRHLNFRFGLLLFLHFIHTNVATRRNNKSQNYLLLHTHQTKPSILLRRWSFLGMENFNGRGCILSLACVNFGIFENFLELQST